MPAQLGKEEVRGRMFHATSARTVARMQRQQILGWAVVLGTLLVVSLVAVGVKQHPISAQGSGASLLHTDVVLLLLYGFAGILVWRAKSRSAINAVMVGGQVGLLVGSVQIANHLIEAFISNRPFVLIITPVLLTLALLGTAGAAACERTRSLTMAVIGGICCAVLATLITLSFAISFNLLFEARVDWQLREAFAASGMIDRGGFLMRNILEALSEILVRMPLFAICLAFTGAVIHAWMSGESRRKLVAAACFLAPLLFIAGAFALWHANGIERAARPPFVISGVLLTGVALCAVYPIWSVLQAPRDGSRKAANS